MPLTRKTDRIITTFQGVKFLMEDGDREVACRVDEDILRERFGIATNEDEAAIFHRNREEIESVANRKYAAGQIEPHNDAMIILRRGDFRSPLSRKL
jgi:hypothetical protein